MSMTIKEAIERAIEGGYGTDSSWSKDALISFHSGNHLSGTLLDPLFWQSLGKALGWEDMFEIDTTPIWAHSPIDYTTKWVTETEFNTPKYDDWVNETSGWEYHWHRFIDHLIEGKTPESFFESLD